MTLILSQEFCTFFEDAVRLLNVKPNEYYLSDTENSIEPVEIAIRMFENHSSIKPNISESQNFYFSNTKVSDILKETTALNNKMNATFGNFPTKRLKEVSDNCTPPLHNIWHKEIVTQKFFKIILN